MPISLQNIWCTENMKILLSMNKKKYKYMDIKCEMTNKYCYCPSAAGENRSCSFTFVNNEKNFIYYDVPKAGSTSIREMLFPDPYYGNEICTVPCRYSVKEKIIEEKEYKTFSFVRNPYDRMVSVFSHFNKNFNMKDYEHISAAFGFEPETIDTFKGFVKMSIAHQNHHWQPQTCFVPEDVDFIGKIENFQRDFDTVCDMIKISRMNILHSNKTNHKHYSTYYDEETYDLVTKRYSDDLKRFNYNFEN
jgi:hypothetical protein